MSDELIYIDNFDGSPERPSMIDNPFVKGNNWLRFIEEEKQITLGEEQLQVLHDIIDIILDNFKQKRLFKSYKFRRKCWNREKSYNKLPFRVDKH